MKKKKYLIKDIAEMAGVSVATVSRVINRNGRFSKETEEKVLQVIRETGYTINYSAKNLRMNRSYTLGLLVPDISNYFFSDLVQKIEELLFNVHYSTIICNTGRSVEKENAYLKMLEGKGVDGLIIISGAEKFNLAAAIPDNSIPYICIDRVPQDKNSTVFISSNHYQGAFEATEHLIKSGVTNPHIAMNPTKSPTSKERLSGFHDALKKNNIRWSEQRIISVDLHAPEPRKKLPAYFERHTDIDGIFATNDLIALELLDFCSERQIKIIGFDDIPYDQYSTPRLSSVHQYTDLIAKNAVKSALSLIEKKDVASKEIIIPVSLTLRESSQ